MNSWYTMQAKAGEAKVKINIHEQIGENWFGEGITARQFIADLDAYDVDEIDLHINSPGGNVFDGTAIYNSLKSHKAKVHVTIDGMAASIASVIAMAGDTIRMPANAMMMIHDPSGFAMGTAVTMRKMARALDKIKGGIVDTYMTRAKDERDVVEQMMADETWITAQEAVELGFADEIIRDVQAQNCAFGWLNQYKKVPAKYLNRADAKVITPNHEEQKIMPITLDQLKTEHPEIVAALLDEGKAAGRQEGAKAERERIKAVRAQMLPGHEQLIEDMANDGSTTGEQAAVRILQAEQQLRATVKNQLAADAATLPHVPTTNPPASDPPNDLTTEAGMKAHWDKDADLRAEFMNDFAAYQAYQVATNRGLIKVLRK